jgi:flavin-dependent dehydrogenase
MDRADVVVIGAGLAGLQCARLVARAGLSVILVDRKESPDQFIHTTGIFVRRTFEEFRFPPGCLGGGIRRVSLHGPRGSEAAFESGRDEFRIGRMRTLYMAMLDDARAAGVVFRGGRSFMRLDYGLDRVMVRLRGRAGEERLVGRMVVAADGASSRVAPALGLEPPRQFLTGVEEVFRRRGPQQQPADISPDSSGGTRHAGLRCFLDPQVAPGYLAWIADDGEEVHAGAAGEASLFDGARALAAVRRLTVRHLADSSLELIERRGGRIPVGGILPEIATTRGLLVGDAAGAVSPLTAGGLDAAIRLSAFAAQSIVSAIRDARRLDEIYSGQRFRARFVSRLWMRRLFTLLGPRTVDLGVALLRSTPLRLFGDKIFFGHGSFPIGSGDLAAEFRTIVEEAA